MKLKSTLIVFVLAYVNMQILFAQDRKDFQQYAEATLSSIYKHYYDGNPHQLLLEKYPFDENFKADYLDNAQQAEQQKKYAYLWPFSGSFSAVNVLMEPKRNRKRYEKVLQRQVLPGLDQYRDERRSPMGYASYLNSAPLSDRFYDDNVWLGIDFTDTYLTTRRPEYLLKAKEIWTFVKSGEDDKLGGGIYWCEQKKESKNTCSNAPGSVFALKLFEATQDSSFFREGQRLYEWTKQHLQDPEDGLYWDNISLSGNIGKAKFSYNSGQMLQSAALLYKLTKNKTYLEDAKRIAVSAQHYFFRKNDTAAFPILKNGNIWFHAVMLRGVIELYHQDRDRAFVDLFANNLEYAWKNMRDADGLFYTDWQLKEKDTSKWLLDQCAFVEMYARLAQL